MRRAKLVPDEQGAGRFLPWVLALLVFIATLATLLALSLDGTIRRWDAGIRGTATVEIPFAEAPPLAAQVAAAMRVLEESAVVAAARPLDEAEMRRLLAPWLGNGAGLAGLPLPALIDVVLTSDDPAEHERLRRQLEAAVPAAVLDDHRAWFGRLLRLARAAQATAAGVIALIAASVAAVVVLAIRATLAANRDVLEVLHLIGARDGFVAWQFQTHAVRLSLRGAGIGLSLTLLVGAGLLLAWAGLDAAGPILRRYFGIGHLVGLFAVPAMAVAIATLTARWAVLRELSRMV